MLTIHLQETIPGNVERLYFKNRFRLPTITDINIISNELIVVLHRFTGKVYLIKILPDLSDFEIIDTFNIKYGNYGNGKCQNEIFTRKDNRLYIITFTEYMVIIDIINDNKLKLVGEIRLNTPGNLYHGMEIYNNNLYITPAIIKNNPMHVIKLELYSTKKEKECEINRFNDQLKKNTSKIITSEFIENRTKYRIKDISFFEDGKILLIIMINNGKTKMSNFNHVDSGFIGLYDNNFMLLDKYQVGECHLDSLVTYGNNFYLTVEGDNGGFIYRGSINNEKNIIEKVERTQTVEFPHGIAINQDCNLIGYTSYSTSSAYLMTIEELNNMSYTSLS
jgi:hypothetical protein